MRYTVLTNFDNYTSNISCNQKGVITLTLTPNKIHEISRRTNIITKKRETLFDTKYCTCYMKSENDILYKYTNHKPDNSNLDQVSNIYTHNVPTDSELYFTCSRTDYLLKNYHYRKAQKLRSRYYSYQKKHL